MEMKRLCKICGMPLSGYNRANVCFCHKEHPDYRERNIYNPHKPPSTGYESPGRLQADMDYFGQYKT